MNLSGAYRKMAMLSGWTAFFGWIIFAAAIHAGRIRTADDMAAPVILLGAATGYWAFCRVISWLFR